MENKKVVVGMSGGVDSSVAAFLLKKEGYEVIGVTLKMWCEDETYVEDAKKVAKYLGIEYHALDFGERFQKCVIEPFIREYEACRTPNPCIVCNRMMKWEALLKWAKEQGADYVATGHYARIIKLPNGRYTVTDAKAEGKDQTYVLYRLTQEQLAHTLMPIGDYTKEQVREIARETGIPVAEKKDSQDICFIPDGDYASFIHRNTANDIAKPGNFVDTKGNILGQHKGLIHYTIGQRKGLNLAMGVPVFVVALLKDTNEVVVGTNEEVFANCLSLSEINCVGMEEWSEDSKPFPCIAKIRYAHKGAPCMVIPKGTDKAEVVFEEPQRAITPGQSVVFYRIEDGNRILLGGGTIDS